MREEKIDINKKKVAAIVVTYNRKELLAECLAAICAQEYKPQVAYVVDNASTDGTDEWVRANHYDTMCEGINFHYVRLPENIGGSGGFYTGLKMAHESEDNFDAFWLMDDDGVADKAQLKNLVAHLEQYDYLAPLVVSKEDSDRCAFYDMSVEEMKSCAVEGVVPDKACPFNGILYSRKLVDKIGYPIRDMFIWGDEWNYHCRCRNAGFPPVTIPTAVHTHPKDRQVIKQLWHTTDVVPEQDWKLYVYLRNWAYTSKSLAIRRRRFVVSAFYKSREYLYYFIIKEPSIHKLRIVLRAIYDGTRLDLTRLSHYRK